MQTKPEYRPGGLWYTSSEPFKLGQSAYFLLPPPWHPVEVVAAVRGAWPVIDTADPAEAAKAIVAGEARAAGTLTGWAEVMARVLGWTAEQATLAYHLCTPLSTNEQPNSPREGRTQTAMVTWQLFRAAGLTLADARQAWNDRRTGLMRADFWKDDDVGLVRRAYDSILEGL